MRRSSSRCTRLMPGLLALCFLVFIGTSGGHASQQGPTKEPEEAIALATAVMGALEHNLDIAISRQNAEARLTDVLFEQAKFDPTLDITGRYDRFVTPLNQPILGVTGPILNEPATFDQNVTTLSMGLKQKLLTGGDYDLTFQPLDRTFIANPPPRGFLFNPAYQSNVTLNLSQPLLRDFGPEVNRTLIRIAQNSAKIEEQVFLDQVLTIIASVEQAFWELVFTREGLKVAQTALRAAEALEDSNRAKAKAGTMAIVDVLQAEAAVANRVEEVIVAEKAIRDREDLLRQLLSPSEESLRRTVRLTPTDKPTVTLEPISLQETIDIAIARRPDILQAEKNIEARNMEARFAKNQILPGLALQGTAGLLGLAGETSDGVRESLDGQFYTLGAGLVLSYPLGNRSAWSRFNRRRLEARNAQTSLQRVRQQVIITIREAVRRVQTDFKRIETTRSARILAAKQLKAEQERLNVGLSTTRFVLDFQRDLAIAQRNELRAIIDYNNSLSNLAQQTGTTLDTYRIELQ